VTAAITAFAPGAAAAAPSATTNTADAAQVAQNLSSGTLAAHHGVRRLCLVPLAGRIVDLGCRARAVTTSTSSQQLMTTAKPAGYGPADLADAYNLPSPGVGSGNTVTLVGIGAYPSLESDLAQYRSQYGLPPCTTGNGCLSITDYHGGPALQPGAAPPSVAQAYATETALDVDMASAACPTCKIRMVQIPFNLLKLLSASTLQLPGPLADDFGTAVDEAVELGTSSVSMSYGLSNGLQKRYLTTGHPAQALHHPGVAIVASSGDSGYTGKAQIWPQEVRWVTSAGGTTLTKASSGYRDTAWGEVYKKDGSWIGAGSGCVPGLAPAVGQPASVAANCDGNRAASDVSADADPYTGVAVYDTYMPSSGGDGGWLVVGGTSASSPFLAGLYARAGNLSGVEGPNTMYSAPDGSITDVVGGTNAQGGAAECTGDGYTAAVCTGVAGWDGPTGVGVPNGLGAF
jgi:subtilase family serine protease